ncbi:hypothetical protein [Oenococcus oeni]|uniref:hypothetical protein n=1 Tax=Oenococcus oeni TaxID=1247 RepID=UPI000A946D5E|nr:hypothetical protein [Oenococcus oeni]
MSKQINRKDRFKAGIFGIIGGLMVGVAGMSGGAPINLASYNMKDSSNCRHEYEYVG